jgi:hypothetical protein
VRVVDEVAEVGVGAAQPVRSMSPASTTTRSSRSRLVCGEYVSIESLASRTASGAAAAPARYDVDPSQGAPWMTTAAFGVPGAAAAR